jgi:hypothetical protein
VEEKILIRAGHVEAEAILKDNQTARAVLAKLPIRGTVNTWGEEIYFEIPVEVSLDETAREVVERGDLGIGRRGGPFASSSVRPR